MCRNAKTRRGTISSRTAAFPKPISDASRYHAAVTRLRLVVLLLGAGGGEFGWWEPSLRVQLFPVKRTIARMMPSIGPAIRRDRARYRRLLLCPHQHWGIAGRAARIPGAMSRDMSRRTSGASKPLAGRHCRPARSVYQVFPERRVDRRFPNNLRAGNPRHYVVKNSAIGFSDSTRSQMILKLASNGTARSTPTMPQSQPHNIMAMKIATGLGSSPRPKT
jgi:hypothetical protein